MQSFCIHTRLLLTRSPGFGHLARCRGSAFQSRPAASLSLSLPLSSSRSPLLRANNSHLKQSQQIRFSSYRYRRFDPEGRNQSQGQKQNYQKEQTWSRFGPIFRVQYIWRNYRNIVIGIGVIGGVFYVSNLEKVPFTGRWRFNVVSPDTERELTAASYPQTLAEFRGRLLPENHPYTILTARVVERLLPASGLLNPASGDDKENQWVVHVIDDPKQINAFVMPGGKVFVFTGLLPVARDEAGLAAVLGHEIAHVVAHHSAERLSSNLFAVGLAIAASLILDVSGNMASMISDLFLTLPNTRTQESEADHIGLLIMAESCYPPSAAVDLWTRMDQAQKELGDASAQTPQFLSTHPTSSNRRERIRGWLPQAEAKYESSQCAMMARQMPAFLENVSNPFSGRTIRPSARSRPQVPDPVLDGIFGGGGRRNAADDDDDSW